MHKNIVQRTKIYFFFLASITTVSLTYLTFKWGTISKVYKITNHETHVHIQQLPAIDNLSKSVARHLENQPSTSNKPRTVTLNNRQTEKEDLLTGIAGKVFLNNISINRNKTAINVEGKSTTIPLKTTDNAEIIQVNLEKPDFDHKETSKNGINIKGASELSDKKKINVNQHFNNSSTAEVRKYLVAKNSQMNETKFKTSHNTTNIKSAIELKQTKENPDAITGATNDLKNLKFSSVNQSLDTDHSRKAIYDKTKEKKTKLQSHADKENVTNASTNPSQKTQPTNLEMDLSNKTLSSRQDKTPDVGTQTKEKTSKVDFNTMKEMDIKEKLLMGDTKDGIELEKENGSKNLSETKDNIDNQATHPQGSNVQSEDGRNEYMTADNSNNNNNQRNVENATKLNSKTDLNKDFDNKRRQVEEKINSIKQQLFNWTIISNSRKQTVQKESNPNIKVERNDLITKTGSVNRYLQQRLRHLGLHNRMHPMFNNVPDLDENGLQREGGTARPDVCKSCFTLDFRRILNEEKTCTGSDVDVLILISSAPQNKLARAAIRETWGKVCRTDMSRIKCLFVLGNASNEDLNAELKKESSENHDMIQMDFKDSYANLTYKTMTGLKWANEYCKNAKFVMKTDDDMYVNTVLLPLLANQIPQENFLGGRCWGPSSPHRDRSSKWYVSFQMYSGGYFPSMCSGTGYILSSNIIPKLLTVSRNIPFFYLEDVYLAICLNKIGLHPSSISDFNNELTPYSRCEYKNTVITSHHVEPERQKYYWEDSRLCEETRPQNLKFSLVELY